MVEVLIRDHLFYKRLCDQWENEADEAIAELERQQGRAFTEAQKAVFRARRAHRFFIPEDCRWGDMLAVSVNLGEELTLAMRAVADANEELKGVFTVDWNQPAPDGSGRPLIPNEVVYALIQHFNSHDLSNCLYPALPRLASPRSPTPDAPVSSARKASGGRICRPGGRVEPLRLFHPTQPKRMTTL
jgi:hypothetical protein